MVKQGKTKCIWHSVGVQNEGDIHSKEPDSVFSYTDVNLEPNQSMELLWPRFL